MEKLKKFYYSHENVFSIIKKVLPYLFPLLCFVNLAVFLSDSASKMLDSDMSSELVLGKLLSEEGGLLSTNWYYSTELRVLNTQIVYSTLFRFTDDWGVVRYLGSLINSLIYAVSCGYMVYQAGLKKYVPLITGILLMPFSNEYFKMMLYASYYVPHVAISFVFLGMLFAYLRSENKKAQIIYPILLGLLSFISCLGGLRQLCILFVPLLGASFIILLLKMGKVLELTRKEMIKNSYVKLIIVSLSATILGALGYIINQTVLRNYFKFHYFGGIEFVEFSTVSMTRALSGFCELFGGDSLGSGLAQLLTFIFSMFLFVFTVYSASLTIFRHKKSTLPELILAAFSIVGILVMVVIYGGTNFEYTRRYLLPIFIFFIPNLVIYIKNYKSKKDEKKPMLTKVMKCVFSVLLVLILSIPANTVFEVYENYRPTRKLGEVAEIIQLHDCYEGYATFWNANVMTELSNGKIEVRTWWSNSPVNELDRYHNWLHVKDFGEEEHEGKIFLLFTKNEFNESGLKDSLNYAGLVLNTDQHVLFIFDSMDDIFHA